MKKHPLKLIHATGSECPKCGDIVGAHSDYCLDCGYDAATFTAFDWIVCIGLGLLFAAGMISAT